MDNGVYGLTKGQSSPTTLEGTITSSTPFGKLESKTHPLELYLTMGVSFIASGFSSQPRPLAKLITQGMEHPGFSIVHVQSPCTTYNDTFDLLKGKPKEGIPGLAFEIPEDHDPSSAQAATDLLDRPGIPLGVVFRQEGQSLQDRYEGLQTKAPSRTDQEILDSYLLQV